MEDVMRTMPRRVVLAVLVAATVAVGPAAWAQNETFDVTIDAARLATDRHTIVVTGTYTCGPLDLNVVGGGGTVDLTVRQHQVTDSGSSRSRCATAPPSPTRPT
jgi:hypothetical protein